MNDLKTDLSASSGNSRIIYFLYLASLVFGITSLVGLVMAYLNRADAETWLQSHYSYQIRTFWIGLLYSFIAFWLVFILIGYVLMLVIVVWLVIRCVKGLKALDQQEAIADENRWGF